jgi:hypothetical protein
MKPDFRQRMDGTRLIIAKNSRNCSRMQTKLGADE